MPNSDEPTVDSAIRHGADVMYNFREFARTRHLTNVGVGTDTGKTPPMIRVLMAPSSTTSSDKILRVIFLGEITMVPRRRPVENGRKVRG